MGLGLLGFCAVVVGFLTLVVVAVIWGVKGDDGGDPQALVPWAEGLGVVLVGAVIATIGGLGALRGHRHGVLFLRRFGYDDATRTVTSALSVLGRSWRVVTLDDSEVATVGARRSAAGKAARSAREHVGKIAGVGSAVVVLAAATAFALDWDKTREPSELVPAGLLEGEGIHVESSSQAALLAVAALIATAIGVGLAVKVLFPLRWASARIDRHAQAADDSARTAVTAPGDVEVVAQIVETMRRRVFSPQLMVVRSTDELWRSTVQRLARATQITIVDVSRPTASLLWEIQELTERRGVRCVFIGQVDMLAKFIPGVAAAAPRQWHVRRYDALAAPPQSVVAQIERILQGRDVIAYSSDQALMPQFARRLRCELETAV